MEQIVKLTYYWVYKHDKCPAEFVARELRIGSQHTLVDWYNFASEVCEEIIQKDSEQIGGEGKEVEADESNLEMEIPQREESRWCMGVLGDR